MIALTRRLARYVSLQLADDCSKALDFFGQFCSVIGGGLIEHRVNITVSSTLTLLLRQLVLMDLRAHVAHLHFVDQNFDSVLKVTFGRVKKTRRDVGPTGLTETN